MPRAASTSNEEKTVKKAPRKRAAANKASAAKKTAAPRKTTARKAPSKKAAPRKTPTKQVADNVVLDAIEVPEVEVEKVMSSTRKAPTKFAAAEAQQKSKRNQYIVVAFLILIGVGSSAAIGLSDSEAGQINVAQTIKERNERMANLVDVNGPTVIVPTPSQVPDGGLVGLRPAAPAPDPDPVATSTAATSTLNATSTATSSDSAAVVEDESTAAGQPENMSATDTATTTVEAVAND